MFKVSPCALPQVAYLLLCIVLLDYLHDAWFYWTHRALHWRPLYRWVHWEHHRWATWTVRV
jgi:sterol desaturase/sphingolipid hydroxylase (fatty acid hydroxylase superfamily)